MNYGELIKDAFWISWRNRFLWFFGFFAGGTSAGANCPPRHPACARGFFRAHASCGPGGSLAARRWSLAAGACSKKPKNRP